MPLTTCGCPAEARKYMSAFVDGLLQVAEGTIPRTARARAQKSSGRRPARRDRVAKKKKGKGGGRCPGCRARMGRRDAACRKCGRTAPMAEARAAMKAAGVSFVGKSMRPRCPRCGATSIPSARHCTSCGRALLTVVKSAAETERDRYMALVRREPDPSRREVYYKLANPQVYGKGTAS